MVSILKSKLLLAEEDDDDFKALEVAEIEIQLKNLN